MTQNIDHPFINVVNSQSLLASLMQCQNLAGCCLAQSQAPLLQSTIVGCCHSLQYNIKSTHVAIILAINSIFKVSLLRGHHTLATPCILQCSKYCCHPLLPHDMTYKICFLLSSFQSTAYKIFDCCILMSCNGYATSLPPLRYDLFTQHQKYNCCCFSHDTT